MYIIHTIGTLYIYDLVPVPIAWDVGIYAKTSPNAVIINSTMYVTTGNWQLLKLDLNPLYSYYLTNITDTPSPSPPNIKPQIHPEFERNDRTVKEFLGCGCMLPWN